MIDKETLYKQLKHKFSIAKDNNAEWYEHAKDAYNLYHGNHWTEEDMYTMRCAGRPYLTFNNIQPFVNAISGSEIGNKQVIKYYARKEGDLKADELLTSIADWFRETTMGDEVDTTIFKDSLICGMGWSETTIDYSNNPDGEPCIRRLDPLKMYWDNNGLEDNLKNAKYLFYVNTLSIEELKALFPNTDTSEFEVDVDNDDKQDIVGTVIEARYKVRKQYIRYINPLDNSKNDVTKDAFDKFKKSFPNFKIEHQEFTKEIIERAFLGKTKILEEPTELINNNNSFGWNVVTAYYDNIKKQYYGIIKGMKDAQLCINKFFSETVYNYNIQAKGGLFVEEGALLSKEQFAETLTRPDQITFLNSGGLNKIRNKPLAEISPILPSLLNYSENQMNQVVGVSKEFLGTREVNQPGILEQQRKQSTLNILSPLFENLKAYRVMQGRDILYLIQHYLSDGRLIKIVGQDKLQYIPLIKDALINKEYDIIVDDAPLSLNSQERDYNTVLQMLPMFGNNLTPELLLEVLKLSPLPSSFIEKAEQIMTSQAPNPQEVQQQEQMQQQATQVAQQKAITDIAKNQAQAQKDIAQADRNKSLAKIHDIQAAVALNNLVG